MTTRGEALAEWCRVRKILAGDRAEMAAEAGRDATMARREEAAFGRLEKILIALAEGRAARVIEWLARPQDDGAGGRS